MKENKTTPINGTWKKFVLFLLFTFSVGILGASAQTTITGTVTDATKEPLPGVSVVVKGTTTGTITDIDGNYSISAKPSDVLEFAFLGMKPHVVTVGNQKKIDVVMDDDAQILTETVVIGYGSAKKADLTGAISSVSSDQILKQPAMNVVSSTQGKIPGVTIINTDAPGSNPTMLIRGLGTAEGGRDPLYIVDGFPVDNIGMISPADIVSMNVLKDASSASIYGLRAANGVVMITTKKGQSGAPKISVDSYVGIKSILKKVKMANASQYITYFNEAQSMSKQYGGSNTYQLADASQQPFNTDWYDELIKTGFFNNNTVSISGGGQAVDYFLSYNFYNEKGILEDQLYQRSTIRNNNVYKFYDDRLKFTQTLNITFTNDNPKPFGAFNDAYRQSPLVATKYANGRYGGAYASQATGIMWSQEGDASDGKLNSIGNPLLSVANANERTQTFNLQAGIEGEFKITDYLKANSRFGATKFYSRNRVFTDKKFNWTNTGSLNNTVAEFEKNKAAKPTNTDWADNSLLLKDEDTYRWTWEGFVTFNKSFSGNNIEAVAGLSREKSSIGGFSNLTGYDVPSKNQYWSINHASSNYLKSVEQNQYTRRSLASYFARVQYNFNHKYYATATIRRDGSSTFKTGSEYWGTFPSFGLGWTLSEEEFMKNMTFINYLKLRGSWGKLGNQNVPFNYTTYTQNQGSGDYNYVFGGQYNSGAIQGPPAKPISWEVIKETDLGFDFTLLGNRLSGGFDYYHKITDNLTLPVNPYMTSMYSGQYFDQIGKVTNTGVEINLGWSDQLPMGLSYNISANYSYNKNLVKSVLPRYEGDTGGSLSDGQITKRLAKDKPLYSWWMYEADGVWQSQAEIDQAIADGKGVYGTPRPGYLKYKDQNGDGKIDDNDKIYAGSYLPTSTYGIHLGLEYKNIDFSVDGYGVAGNKVYNGLAYGNIGGENVSYETFKDRWTGPGSTNSNPGAFREAIASTHYLESGAFFRVNNITLGYTFKDLVFKGSRLRTYLTAQNPFLFTGYSGFSPELAGNGKPKETAGIELTAYPTTRNFLFGFNLQF